MYRIIVEKPLMSMLMVLLLLSFGANAELTDPTMPGDYRPSPIPGGAADDAGMLVPDSMAIQAIFYRPGASSVMVNGQSYRENDLLADYRVKRIMPDGIILLGSEGEKVISFTRTPVKFREEAAASPVKD